MALICHMTSLKKPLLPTWRQKTRVAGDSYRHARHSTITIKGCIKPGAKQRCLFHTSKCQFSHHDVIKYTQISMQIHDYFSKNYFTKEFPLQMYATKFTPALS